MSNDLRTIPGKAALKTWLRQLESQRVETFSFQPTGSLASLFTSEDPSGCILEMLSLVRSVRTSVTKSGGVVVSVRCTLTYHACVSMLDAWHTRRMQKLPREEQQGLELAQGIVRSITARRKQPMERLYMLYSYIGATISYRSGNERSAEFSQLTSAAWTLIRKVGNCQGFAEVMYLCGGMLGFRMGLQSGRSAAGPHMWNTVEMGLRHYAMDCSAAAVARSQSRRMLADYASFLMGRREAAENGLTWLPEREITAIAARLAPAHDYYTASGTAFTTADAAAREIWKRRMAGELLTHVRVRAKQPVTLKELSSAVHSVAAQPEMNRAIFSKLSGQNLRYSIIGSDSNGVIYASVEWKA